jgi:hypothetical protein
VINLVADMSVLSGAEAGAFSIASAYKLIINFSLKDPAKGWSLEENIT